MTTLRLYAVPLLLVAMSAAHARMSPDTTMPGAAPSSTAGASTVLTDGVVQQVDAASGTVTLQHGPITNLGMPGMTMAFGVVDKKLLDPLKAGDKVRFHVDMVKGSAMVTVLQPVPKAK